MVLHRYYRWGGNQEPIPISQDDLIDNLSHHLMDTGDVSGALQAILQHGMNGNGKNINGVQSLLSRLESDKQEILDRYDIDRTIEEIRDQLQTIIKNEGKAIDRWLKDTQSRYLGTENKTGLTKSLERNLLEKVECLTEQKRQLLDNVSRDVPQSIDQLKEYEFVDSQAKCSFDKLVEDLRGYFADSIVKEISDRFQVMPPQNIRNLEDMLADLNKLIEESSGDGVTGFSRFMQKHGNMFLQELPRNLEELAEFWLNQMSQYNSLIRSLSPSARQELQDAIEVVMPNNRLAELTQKLHCNISKVFDLEIDDTEFIFQGKESLGLDKALDIMGQLESMEQLKTQLTQSQDNGNLSTVDKDLMRHVLGEDANHQLEMLENVADMLEENGYIRYTDDRLELTPKGMRLIGEKALKEVFTYLKKDRLGNHHIFKSGFEGELESGTKVYEHEDTFQIHLQRSLLNAVSRNGGVPINLEPKDFEIYKTESLVHASTVLMLDLSLSMAMRGNFQAAKKVALALDNLIRTQFPTDTLRIVGFSTYAREVKPEDLAYLSWDDSDPYTNIQHGLVLARKLLGRRKSSNKQILLISDGEPTAHIDNGELFSQYPSHSRTIDETLNEVRRCSRMGIMINTFMLDRSTHLIEFVDRMARISRGRVFYTTPDKLGNYMLVDYITARRWLVS